MRHTFIVVMLTVGMFGGLLSGIYELRTEAREAKALGWKKEFADICVQAARRTFDREGQGNDSAAHQKGPNE